jgi:hypothetical protein
LLLKADRKFFVENRKEGLQWRRLKMNRESFRSASSMDELAEFRERISKMNW